MDGLRRAGGTRAVRERALRLPGAGKGSCAARQEGAQAACLLVSYRPLATRQRGGVQMPTRTYVPLRVVGGSRAAL